MTAIYWRNVGKRWQNGETESQKNGGVRQAHPPKIFIWITAWKSGCKDSGMEGGKKMLCLGIFSTRHKHTKNLCLWNSSVFGVCWEYWNGWSNFLPPVILLCAVLEADQWRKNLFLFIKIFLAVVCWRYWKKRKRVHHFLPFDSAQGKLLSFGGDMKAYYVGVHY